VDPQGRQLGEQQPAVAEDPNHQAIPLGHYLKLSQHIVVTLTILRR
jgi:hypothetical protein